MKKIIKPKGKGKTTELIQMSHDTWTYILVANHKRVDCLVELAEDLEIDIPYPVTLSEFANSGNGLRHLKNILIDDADDILEVLFNPLNITAITMRDGD